MNDKNPTYEELKDILLNEREFNLALLENMVDGVVACDKDGMLAVFNRTAREWHGFDAMRIPPEEWASKYDLFLEDGVTPMSIKTVPLARAFNGEVVRNAGMAIRAKGKSTRFIIANGSPFYSSDGTKLGAVVVMHDITESRKARILELEKEITERKNTEKKLKENEEFLERSQSIAHVGSWHLDLATNVLTWSDESYRIFGFDPGTMIACYETFLSAVHPDDKDYVNHQYSKAIETKTPYDVIHRVLRPDGSIKVVREVSEETYDNNGKAIASTGMVIDITELKESEAKRNQLSTILERSLNEIYIFGSDTLKFQYVNKGALKNMGYTLEEMMQFTPVEIKPEFTKETFLATIEPLLSGEKEKYVFETVHKRKDGSLYPVEVHLQLIQHGTEKSFVAIILDISERKKMKDIEQQLREQESFAIVGKVAGKIAHDFNNVLGIIMGTSQLLLTENLPDDIKSEIDIIMECSKKGRELTRNLLLYALDQETKLSQFDLSDKINLLLQSLKSDLKGIDVAVNYGLSMKELLADAGLLENALINLIQNSVHAMSKTENPMLKISTFIEDDTICIEIADNGCGIPDEYKNKIFEPTVTLKGSGDKIGAYNKDIKGSGYGLANVKRCIDKHGGKIEFESEEGKGTTFKLSFRIIEADLSARDMAIISTHEIVEGKRILIVEDEPHLGRILYLLLGKFNHNVALTTDGEMAIDHFKKNVYDAISLDFVLPDMNGMEVYKTIRETNKEIPVIFVSGNFEFMQSMIDLKKKDPKVDHLAKPFDNIEYVNKINEWLV